MVAGCALGSQCLRGGDVRVLRRKNKVDRGRHSSGQCQRERGVRTSSRLPFSQMKHNAAVPQRHLIDSREVLAQSIAECCFGDLRVDGAAAAQQPVNPTLSTAGDTVLSALTSLLATGGPGGVRSCCPPDMSITIPGGPGSWGRSAQVSEVLHRAGRAVARGSNPRQKESRCRWCGPATRLPHDEGTTPAVVRATHDHQKRAHDARCGRL